MPKGKDENQLAKSVIDDIIEETESEDWDKEKGRINKKEAPKKNIAKKPASPISTDSRR